MAIVSYALCAVSDVEGQLEETLAGVDIVTCENMINLATQYAEKYIGRQIKARGSDVTQNFDIEARIQEIFVTNFPIISVTSVTEDGTLLTVDVDYLKYDDEGRFVKGLTEGNYWTQGFKKVVIVYEGGYATVPEDLFQWCVEVVSYMFDSKKDGNISNERVGQISVGYAAVGKDSQGNVIPQKAWLQEVLDFYKASYMSI